MLSDPLWKESFSAGQIVEKSNYGRYNTILIKSNVPTGRLFYPYRLFFFENDMEYPSLIINMEKSFLSDELFLGVHGFTKHYNYGTVNQNFSLEEFKIWALSTAEKHIGPPTMDREESVRTEEEMLKEIDELFSDTSDDTDIEKEILDSFPDELIPNMRYVPLILGILALFGVVLLTFKFTHLNTWIKNFIGFPLFIFSIFSLKAAIFSSKKEIFDLVTTTKRKLEIKQEIFNKQLEKSRSHPKSDKQTIKDNFKKGIHKTRPLAKIVEAEKNINQNK